jgi:hypothetical protein
MQNPILIAGICLTAIASLVIAETGFRENIFGATVLIFDGDDRFLLDKPDGFRSVITIDQGWIIHDFEPELSDLGTRVWSSGELRLANGEIYDLDDEWWFEGVTVNKYQVIWLGTTVSTELQYFPDISESIIIGAFNRPGKNVPWEFGSAQYHAVNAYASWSNGNHEQGRLSHSESLALVTRHYGDLMADFVA